jgi:hypothetical protein
MTAKIAGSSGGSFGNNYVQSICWGRKGLGFQRDYLSENLAGYDVLELGRDDGQEKGNDGPLLPKSGSSRLKVGISGSRVAGKSAARAGIVHCREW